MATKKPTHGSSKYNPETIRVMIKFLKEGLFREDSARLAGITPKTMYEWFKKYPSLVGLVEDAEAWNKRSWTKIIAKHAKRSWQAMAWLAERRHDEYSAKSPAQLASPNGVQIAIISGGYVPPVLVSNQPIQVTTGASVDKSLEVKLDRGTSIVDK
ncbi:MAG: hypothetical protein AAB922_07370 [Patescibacteria group bacterium]